MDGFFSENLEKQTLLFLSYLPIKSFTRQDYGVILGYFAVCSAKLRLTCNDYLVKVKYGEQYNVFENFSLVYNNNN